MGSGGRLKSEGTYAYLWLIHVDVWQKSTQYCNYPSIKNKLRRKKKEHGLWSLAAWIQILPGPLPNRVTLDNLSDLTEPQWRASVK